MKASPRERELTRFRAITDLGLPSRATNALLRGGVRSVGQLISWSREDLMTEIVGLGEKAITVIEASLALENLSLARAEAPSAVFAQIPPGRARSRPKINRHVNKHMAWIRLGDEKR